ncbi:MAG TPA: C-GCAxxG-C-C family protein [Candidatus Thermoplasmatota archaeon]|nr:C-GCAxxG-C-C family protein [Candidatus Thermoplasmatota archaeon]
MNSQKDILDDVYQRAFQYEARLGSCPQCVLAALKETLDVGDNSIFKASQGLAGGTALSSEGTCGALAGGMIAIGSLVGRTYQEFSEGKKKRLVFKYTRQLYDRFVREYGSSLCCGVQKKIFGRSYILLDKQQYEAFEKAGAHVDKCTSVAGNAAKWTAEIILNELQGEKQEG